MKDVGLRIRIDRDLREAFLKACEAEDKPAAQVLREYMRAYVREHTKPGYGNAAENQSGNRPTKSND